MLSTTWCGAIVPRVQHGEEEEKEKVLVTAREGSGGAAEEVKGLQEEPAIVAV